MAHLRSRPAERAAHARGPRRAHRRRRRRAAAPRAADPRRRRRAGAAGLEGEPEDALRRRLPARDGRHPVPRGRAGVALRADETLPTADSARRVAELGARAVGALDPAAAGPAGPRVRPARARARGARADAELRHVAALAGLDADDGRGGRRRARRCGHRRARPAARVRPSDRADGDLCRHAALPSGRCATPRGGAAAGRGRAARPRRRAPAGERAVRRRLGGGAAAAAARAAARSGAPESAADYLRAPWRSRAAAERAPALLLELGSRRQRGRQTGRRRTCRRRSTRGEARRAHPVRRARARSRAGARQAFAEAMEVFDRCRGRLDPESDEPRALEAATSPRRRSTTCRLASVAPRSSRTCAAHAAAGADMPARALAVLAVDAVFRCAACRGRRGAGAARSSPRSRGRCPRRRTLPLFHQCAITLLWASATPRCSGARRGGRRARGRGRRRASPRRAATAALSLRRGELGEPRPTSPRRSRPAGRRRLRYRLALSVLVEALTERGLLDAAEQVLAPIEAQSRGRLHDRGAAADEPRPAAAPRRRAPEALADARGRVARRPPAGGGPQLLPWRSQAALALLALGNRPAGPPPGRRGARARPRVRGAASAGHGAARAGLATDGEADPRCARPSRCSSGRGPALELARARTELGAALRRTERPRRARASLHPRARRGPSRGGRGWSSARQRQRSGPPAPGRGACAHRRRVADGEREPGRRARGRGAHEPRDRAGAVRDPAHGGGPPHAGVP